jgi:sulfonate dioxygenase
MIAHAKAAGSLVRKEAIDTVHPLVRVHPVTGEKCLFVNAEFITKILGLKEPETKSTLEFLVNHMIMGHDFQARVKWKPRTIVMFDNRSTIRETSPFPPLSYAGVPSSNGPKKL